jgi:hypothetical protein
VTINLPQGTPFTLLVRTVHTLPDGSTQMTGRVG